MKKGFWMMFMWMAFVSSYMVSFAQEEKNENGYVFTTQKEVKYTPIKNQNRSGTCWSYSGIGFLECELLRQGKESTTFPICGL